MNKLKRQHFIKRRLLYRLALVFLIGVAVLLIRSVWNIYEKQAVANNSRLAAVRRLRELEDRKVELENALLRLSTERGVEGELRSKFPVAKNGEDVVVILDEPAGEPEQEVGMKKESWLSRIRARFGF
ncbi:MAG: hypothetical protein HYS59_02545 [Candidatus Vogelbacteria bacterium]|nr:hypothetical protein [Candidatus Vogelbacteria bacterium]